MLNREISWLSFNERVLQEAHNTEVPLMERIKFLGIFSNNLDEFFRVRVASLQRMLQFKNATLEEKKYAGETLEEIKKQVLWQQEKLEELFEKEIKKELVENNIQLSSGSDLNKTEIAKLKEYFHSNVARRIFPIIISDKTNWQLLKDGAIYLIVECKHPSQDIDLALIELPVAELGRFYVISDKKGQKVLFLDDVIRICLPDIFKSLAVETYNAYTIKITRDAELSIDNELGLKHADMVLKSLKQRKTGKFTRFIYDGTMPKKILNFLVANLKVHKNQVIAGGRYHNFRDFMQFPKIDNLKLYYEKMPPLKLKFLDQSHSLFSEIEKQDILLQFPYQDFDYIIRFLREAAIDPHVYAIRITLYRLAENSLIAQSLINAARNGKQVTVILEVKARFMEEHNIFWANKLREEGVHVSEGIPGIKIHCKLIVVSKKIRLLDTIHFVHIGTGNFNEQTAKLYSDFSLFTKRKRIASEALRVFDLIKNFKPTEFQFQHLWVSPINTRNQILERIDREIEIHESGQESEIILKLNNLSDEVICKRLLKAAQKGVSIHIICRGICRIAVQKELPNLNIISIVDRFLEHSRVFYFSNHGEAEVFIGSADAMQRNLDLRIEVITPVLDKQLKLELIRFLQIQLNDNIKARILDAAMSNKFLSNNAEPIRSQLDYYKLLKQCNNKN